MGTQSKSSIWAMTFCIAELPSCEQANVQIGLMTAARTLAPIRHRHIGDPAHGKCKRAMCSVEGSLWVYDGVGTITQKFTDKFRGHLQFASSDGDRRGCDHVPAGRPDAEHEGPVQSSMWAETFRDSDRAEDCCADPCPAGAIVTSGLLPIGSANVLCVANDWGIMQLRVGLKLRRCTWLLCGR